MWSGPRNLSTALMRSFENRSDTEVLDEPFYSFYLKNTGLKHPMYNKIIDAYPNDIKEILNKITKLPKNNKIYYQKHMTHHLIDVNNLDWLKNGKNCSSQKEQPKEETQQQPQKKLQQQLQNQLSRKKLWHRVLSLKKQKLLYQQKLRLLKKQSSVLKALKEQLPKKQQEQILL